MDVSYANLCNQPYVLWRHVLMRREFVPWLIFMLISRVDSLSVVFGTMLDPYFTLFKSII